MVNKFPFTDQFFGQDKERIYDTFDYKAKNICDANFPIKFVYQWASFESGKFLSILPTFLLWLSNVVNIYSGDENPPHLVGFIPSQSLENV